LGKNKQLRNLAMQLASQLPDEPADLYLVIDLMRELADYWLYCGRMLYPQGSVPVTEAYLDERLREVEARAARAASLSEAADDEASSVNNVIKFAGKPERSPR